jgi:hypothetical protein
MSLSFVEDFRTFLSSRLIRPMIFVGVGTAKKSKQEDFAAKPPAHRPLFRIRPSRKAALHYTEPDAAFNS